MKMEAKSFKVDVEKVNGLPSPFQLNPFQLASSFFLRALAPSSR